VTRFGKLAAMLCVLGGFSVNVPGQATPPPQPPAPHLEARGDDAQVPVDARITAPVTIPNEAWGHYSFGRELDLLEVDLEPKRGVTGYIMLLGGKGPDKNAPLAFFFTKTRVGGDSVYFLTQQIHRVSYEFNGELEQSAPKEHTLDVDYSLVGTLTTHRAMEDGSDKRETKQVTFKRVAVRSR
jgi:hypothetical protein